MKAGNGRSLRVYTCVAVRRQKDEAYLWSFSLTRLPTCSVLLDLFTTPFISFMKNVNSDPVCQIEL